ncbi:Cell surface receptor IPT/TIG domain protein [Candidatus Sulfopaludibacter sp. SbA3]|nr:Cell surface receptor IPT/TIG domain protein [Candidatus Sulfopaludibacter sp. SbA3]
MSNYMAIATVTATLQQILQPAVSQAVAGASFGFSRPTSDGSPKTPQVNVFLYQVTPNAAYRNRHLPGRRSDGTLVRRPQAALDLHYLFTFHGDDTNLEPQRLLGAVVTALENQSTLTPDDINSATSPTSKFPFLQHSGLDQQIERVKFTPTALSIEEFSKLWSAFFQVEYSLSVAYHASVVLMESDVTPQEALPVEASNVYVTPFRWPQIDRVVSQTGAADPITSSSTLQIQGKQLRGVDTVVLMEGGEIVPTAISDAQLTVPVPANVHAGLKALQVAHRVPMGNPQTPHRGFESNVVAFVLHPSIVNVSAATSPDSTPTTKITNITLQLAPNIGVGQRAIVVLNLPLANPPQAYASLPVVSAADSNQVIIPIENVPPGSYVVRVQIDGAESLLTMAGEQFNAPAVTVL